MRPGPARLDRPSPRLARTLHPPCLVGVERRRPCAAAGIRESATKAQIKDAHRKIMLLNHPDRGGSPFIATKINQASEVMMGQATSRRVRAAAPAPPPPSRPPPRPAGPLFRLRLFVREGEGVGC